MIYYYLDASAWVKRYVIEPGSKWFGNIFDDPQLLASSPLGFVEVISTLARKNKALEIERDHYKQTVLDLEEDWQGIIKVQLDSKVIDIAKDIAQRLALKGADTIHLASALLLGNDLKNQGDQLILVASDHQLLEGAKSSGIDVIDPEEQE